jgi:hypothetical protein
MVDPHRDSGEAGKVDAMQITDKKGVALFDYRIKTLSN